MSLPYASSKPRPAWPLRASTCDKTAVALAQQQPVTALGRQVNQLNDTELLNRNEHSSVFCDDPNSDSSVIYSITTTVHPNFEQLKYTYSVISFIRKDWVTLYPSMAT